MPKIANKNLCTGCAACYSSCKFDAIKMVEDPKDGFFYPQVDDAKCVNCSTCENACPIVTKMKFEGSELPYACVAINKNRSIRAESTSGGAFTAIAEVILDKGGVVFGAIMDASFHVKHIYVENKGDLRLFRNSKYVQSNVGDSLKECRFFLDHDRWVLFSGTPCQVNGLLCFLGKKYEKLITIDVVCHSGPSPLIFKKYIGYQQGKGKPFDTVVFREKKRGYTYSNMVLFNGDKEVIRAGSECDPWFRIFLHAHSDRLSCFDCKAQETKRINDITLWDCYKVKKLAPEFDDNKGATNCVAWTLNGKSILDEARLYMHMVEVPFSIHGDALIRKKTDVPINRDQFFKDANTLSDVEFIAKYFPENLKVKTKSLIRRVLIRLRLHDFVRDIVHRL